MLICPSKDICDRRLCEHKKPHDEMNRCSTKKCIDSRYEPYKKVVCIDEFIYLVKEKLNEKSGN